MGAFESRKPPMLFKVLLVLNFALVAALLLNNYVVGPIASEQPGSGRDFLKIAAIYIATPLWIPFVAMNIWGIFKYRYKLIYILLAWVSLVWVVYGFYMGPKYIFR